jgi:hypothetical protein
MSYTAVRIEIYQWLYSSEVNRYMANYHGKDPSLGGNVKRECDGKLIDDGSSDCYNCQTEGCDGWRFSGECLLCGSEACWERGINIDNDMLSCTVS